MALDQEETLRDGLEAAFESADNTAEVIAEPVEQEEKPSRVRDESGKFAKADKVEQAEIPSGEEVVAKEGVPEVPEDLIPEAPQADAKRAPSSWKKEAAAEFNALPSHVQDEILRRESDFHKGIEGFKQHADHGRKFEQAMMPYADSIKEYGIDNITAATEMMKTHHTLKTAPPTVKLQKMMELAAHYGIDLQQQFDPNVARYEAEMHRLRQQNEEIIRQNQSRETESVNTAISQFAEQPGHEHFDSVREHMAALLQGGQAKDLQDAYDQAVYANPTTRAMMLEQQTRKVQDDFNAKRAKAASVSVRGSSPSSGTAPQKHDSLRGALEGAFANYS